jgi:hypothetical protein
LFKRCFSHSPPVEQRKLTSRRSAALSGNWRTTHHTFLSPPPKRSTDDYSSKKLAYRLFYPLYGETEAPLDASHHNPNTLPHF